VIALDTNVLVRFLVEDDPAQCRRAKTLLQKAMDAGEPCFVSDVVLCEIVWVLETSYKVARVEVASILDQLLRARHLAFPSSERLARALSTYESGRGDFADYLIREWAREGGCETVMTFDRDLLRESGFTTP
jgi:predicted nucleic-acid-binding protein